MAKPKKRSRRKPKSGEILKPAGIISLSPNGVIVQSLVAATVLQFNMKNTVGMAVVLDEMPCPSCGINGVFFIACECPKCKKATTAMRCLRTYVTVETAEQGVRSLDSDAFLCEDCTREVDGPSYNPPFKFDSSRMN